MTDAPNRFFTGWLVNRDEKVSLTFRTLKLSLLVGFLSCIPNPAVSEDAASERELPHPTLCEYVNFAIYSDIPGAHPAGEGLASKEIRREVEELFALELEKAGFFRVSQAETPWLYIRAVLQSSTLIPNAVTGVVEFKATASFNRDYALALSDNSVPNSPIGGLTAIENPVRFDNILDPARLKTTAAISAKKTWQLSSPAISRLCTWRTQLIDDGLTIDTLHQRVMDETVRILSEQRKKTFEPN